MANVSAIFIYPIKSCGGISVPQAPLTPTGFRWDRQWLVVNYKGRAYTQRVEPKLSLVEVELSKDAFLEDWKPSDTSFLVIKAPGMDVLKVPLREPPENTDGVSVWEWSGSALDEGDAPSKWFSDFLGKPSRLVRFNAASQTRKVNANYGPGHQIMFSDEFPYMLISQGSLDALNEVLKEPVSINRFRPNILVDGCEPFSEDLWTEIGIDKFIFQCVRLCARCKVPSINQETGIAGPEPNETLKKIRSDTVLRPKHAQKGQIFFGQNLVWKNLATEGKGKIIKVGDKVNILGKVSSVAEAVA
ncbi:mitochondrial amidoxime-reducing component 1 [Cucurbita moschata]|uniref:Mitochondrial amidoxime-reducing component 1 n=1 Tax=Cucurbita moschata TaxID=3662 RepID=A0A6J1EGH6_CUCMO|nr:mitochondrial amidoxime-reducing component 1 [Cucurbita moschata]